MLITSKLIVFQPTKYIIFLTQKLRATKRNGLQIRILHQKIHRCRKKKHPFFYMTLKDNNNEYNLLGLLPALRYGV